MIQASEPLIKAACSGDEQALSQLLTVCQPDLKRFARRTCSTTEDAEDAVQIALWQLYKQIGALRTVAAFASWLFRIVERECYRLFKQGSRTDALSESFSEQIASPGADANLHIDLTRSIATLPQAYRKVLIMRDIEELTAPEVADQLGISVEAVKSRLHRARTMVRTELSDRGYISTPHSENNSGG